MAEPFIGQIVMFGGNFAPRGWALCDGQLLPISSYSALFSILGTTYGGDGTTTFALPDLRGRLPMHPGNGPGLASRSLGQKSGNQTTTLAPNHLPAHTHNVRGNNGQPNESNPENGFPANSAAVGEDLYHSASDVNMGATTSVGSAASFSNEPPFQCVHFIIALLGTFPSRN